MGNYSSYFTFNDGSSASTGDGNIYYVSSGNTLQVEMSSQGTGTVVFEGIGELGIWRPLLGTQLTTPIALMTSTSDFTTFYQFDISGVTAVKMRISVIGTYPITIVGKVVG